MPWKKREELLRQACEEQLSDNCFKVGLWCNLKIWRSVKSGIASLLHWTHMKLYATMLSATKNGFLFLVWHNFVQRHGASCSPGAACKAAATYCPSGRLQEIVFFFF